VVEKLHNSFVFSCHCVLTEKNSPSTY